jgi:predicted Zn-dependent protease
MVKRVLPSILAGLMLAGCATVPFTGRSQLSLVPQSELVAMGGESYHQFIADAALSQDAGATAMVRRVGERVARSAETFLTSHGLERDLRYYDWEFNLIDDDETANAFCVSGGKIAVYTGILPITGDEDGLAVVVAHEVAHALANHGGERMSQLLVAELGGMALSKAVEEEPQRTQELWLAAYGIGAQFGFLLPYSRQHESEADRIGLILMAQAGYHPEAAIPFWRRMAAQGGARPPEFLSTHPSPETRIEDIRRYLPEALQYYSPQP